MKYRVSVPYVVWVTDEIEADDIDGALEKSYELQLSSYAGNNAYDRLVGVTSGSVEVCDEPLGTDGIEIQIDRVEEQ